MKGRSRRVKKSNRVTRKGGAEPKPRYRVGQTVVTTTDEGVFKGTIKGVEKVKGKFQYKIKNKTRRGVFAFEDKIKLDAKPT